MTERDEAPERSEEEIKAAFWNMARRHMQDYESGALLREAGSDPFRRAIAEARARLLQAIRDQGLLTWVATAIGGGLMLVRGLLLRWRTQVSNVVATAAVAIADASSILAAAAVVAVAFSPIAAPPAAIVARASGIARPVSSFGIRHEGVGSHCGSKGRASASDPLDTLRPPADPAHVYVGTQRDRRRIAVTHWVFSWLPGGTVEHEGDDVWWTCDPESIVSTAICATYDKLPEGPWGP